ncbi:hypothetical protein P8452_18675 [Trifolium repens]|nr:hypothetical protein P8452_18675 [Trifolium repens]
MNIELHSCVNTTLHRRVNTTCVPRKSIIMRVKKGISANVFVDNIAYRDHLRSNFDATPTDMESADMLL